MISIIIPVYNEEENIAKCIRTLEKYIEDVSYEIIVVDGGSTDNTIKILRDFNVTLLNCDVRSRAIQMNYGAEIANGDILYFLHADTLVPKAFGSKIMEALKDSKQMGCFRFKFDSNRLFLKINSFFTRFNYIWCRGGDQSLFILKKYFIKLGAFKADHLIMEEYPLIKKGMKSKQFVVLDDYVIGSARKYSKNGYLKVQWTNFVAFRMFNRGVPAEIIKTYYNANLES